MNKRISSFISIGLIFTIVIWMIDKQSVVRINFMDNTSKLSLPEAMIIVLIAVVAIDFMTSLVKRLFIKQLKEAYKTSVLDKNTDESAAIDALASRITEKMVIDRQAFDEAMLLVLKAMTAITAGDMIEAKNVMRALKRIVGNDPILDLLQMKIYKGEKDFDKMSKLSNKLMKNQDVQMVGFKAAVESQMQKKEFETALKTANKAFELRQDLYWVIESAFELRARNNDWEGAMQVFNAGVKKKIIPEAKQRRFKSTVLFELAKQAKEKEDDTNFFKLCSQAFDTDKTLSMAAIELARYYVKEDNQYRKAANILTTAWKKNPIDLIAYEYLNLFNDKTAKEKIARMEKFAFFNAKRPSLNNRILAELCAEQGLWQKAKGEIEVFLINNPATQIICDLISKFEKEFNKDKKAAKKWEEKIATSAEDSKWVCANCHSEYNGWQAVCPHCGTFGETRWHLYVEKDRDENDFDDDFTDDDND
ncbi:MAG: hypothetical protein R3Y43_00800 [Alphaproteobacteria bacterium]